MYVLNVLGVVELLVLVFGTYYFMSHANREIFLKKRYYMAAFLLYGIILMAAGMYFQDDRVVLLIWVLLSVCIGHFLFSRKIVAKFYDVMIVLALYLCQMAVGLGTYMWFIYRRIIFNIQEMILAEVVCILLEVFVTVGLTMLVQKKKIVRIKRMQSISMLLMPVFSLIFIVSLMTMGQTYMAIYGMGMFLLNLLLLFGLNVYYIVLFARLSKANELQSELELFQSQSEMQYRYYSELEEKFQESRKMVHDMRNHLHAIENLYEEGENGQGKQYVQDIHEMLNRMGQKYYTSCRMLNIILNDKVRRAGRKGVCMEVKIGDISLEHIRDVDITTIFANVLDNAIEAAAETTHGIVEVKADYVREYIVVKIQNAKREGSQRKPGHMGIGLENVRNTLKKYDGDMQTEERGEVFQSIITIPKRG